MPISMTDPARGVARTATPDPSASIQHRGPAPSTWGPPDRAGRRPNFFRKISLAGAAVLIGLLVAACGDSLLPGGPGALTATLSSPHGSEGAILMELTGPGIGEIEASEGEVFVERSGESVRVLMVREMVGPIAFTVDLDDRSTPPVVEILEVSGPDDVLRPDLSGYAVEFTAVSE